MPRIRSFLFDIYFYLFTFFFITPLAPLMLVLPRRWLARPMHTIWSAGTMWGLKHIVKLTWRIEGKENLEQAFINSPFILASKHQSAWDTIIFSLILKDFAFVIKRELMWIPVFNLYLWKLRSIALNRKKGITALRKLIKSAKQLIQDNHCILIFPEGTRSLVGEQLKYQPGISVLYDALQRPVLPVALNSGLFWGRRSSYKKPGEIILNFLPLIEPGLKKNEFMEKLAHTIESSSLELLKNKASK